MAKLAATVRQNKKTQRLVNPKSAVSVAAATDVSRWLLPLAVVVFTLLVFLPSLQNGFVNWDDPPNLLENLHYRGLTWAHLYWMFTSLHEGHYQPLTWVTFAVDYLLWGMNPFGYHLTSIFLHAVNAALFYFLALRLLSIAQSSSEPSRKASLRAGAAFSAVFFAIHPLRVESVTWVTERRDVLSGLFLLSTVFLYLRAVAAADVAHRSLRLGWTLFVYVLSLLSKAGGITLPIVLIVLDVYPLRRLGWRTGRWFGKEVWPVWFEKIPFLIFAGIFALVALSAQREATAALSLEQYGIMARFVQSLYGLLFYLVKTIVPVGLSPLYDLRAMAQLWSGTALFLAICVVLITACLYLLRRRWPAGLACWISYVVLLAPVLGVAQSGVQMVADRYSYLSCLGLALLAGAGFTRCWLAWANGNLGRAGFVSITSLGAFVLGGLAVLTMWQEQIWHDSEKLWRHALSVTSSAISHYNLAVFLAGVGRIDEAMDEFKKTLDINPLYPNAYQNLATIFAERGALDEAANNYRRAAELNPSNPEIYGGLGLVLARQGRVVEAVEIFRRSLSLNPNDGLIHFNLARALVQQGQLDEAERHFHEAVKIRPDFPEAYHDLGRIVAARGELEKAIDYFRQALGLRPDFAEAHASLAMALVEQGKKDEAAQHYEEALRIMKSSRARN